MRDWLKKIRISENMTCKQIAEKCGFSPEFFTMIEKGNRRPSPDYAKKIAIALNFFKYGYDWTIFYSQQSIGDQGTTIAK
jgi:transcriptional regulator with XRE-family HTH domain